MEKIISKLLPVDAATSYLKDVLATGGGSTSGSVDQRLRSAPIYALAPEGISTAQLIDFAHGGILTAGPKISDGTTSIELVPTTVKIAASIVREELLHCEQPVLWVHEPILSEEEVALRKLPYKIVDGNIYLVFDGSLSEKDVAELIKYSHLSWHFLALVVERQGRIESVDELILSAKFILVGAYDGESFLYSCRG